MQPFIGREDMARLERPAAAFEIADKPAGFAHEQDAGRDVPGFQPALPEAVEPAGRDIGKIESRGAEAPHAGRRVHHFRQFAEKPFMALASKERNAGRNDRFREVLANRHAQALVVEIGAVALLGHVHLVRHRIVDEARDELAFPLQRDGNREDAGCRAENSSCRRCGSMMKRWDLSGPSMHARFLDQEAVAGPRARQFLDQDALGALVGDGDEIGRTLERNLQIFEFAEIADQGAAGLARGG